MSQTYSRTGIVVDLSDPCEWCGNPFTAVYDHAPCLKKAIDRASRKIGRSCAKRQNQKLLGILLGSERAMADESDPVEQRPDGKWIFWDETWAFEHGPYDTEAQAREYLAMYAKECL